MDSGTHFKCWGNSGSPIKRKQLRTLVLERVFQGQIQALNYPQKKLQRVVNYPSEKPKKKKKKRGKLRKRDTGFSKG